jgi:hypothetical protein
MVHGPSLRSHALCRLDVRASEHMDLGNCAELYICCAEPLHVRFLPLCTNNLNQIPNAKHPQHPSPLPHTSQLRPPVRLHTPLLPDIPARNRTPPVTRHVRNRKRQLAQGLSEEDRVAHCAIIERLRREEGRGARGCGRHGLDLGAWAGRIWGLVLRLRLWLWM